MAVRATMADIIARLRLLIGDPLVTIAGTPVTTSSVFADQELQDFLDSRRTDIVEVQLAFRPTTTGGAPAVQYRDYWAPFGNWEQGVVLKDATTKVITADVEDLLHAHWYWAAGQLPPVFICGVFYDVYGSAVQALEAWMAKVALDFDFMTDRQTFTRTGKLKGLQALADTYRKRAVPPGRRPEWRSAEWRSPLWE